MSVAAILWSLIGMAWFAMLVLANKIARHEREIGRLYQRKSMDDELIYLGRLLESVRANDD